MPELMSQKNGIQFLYTYPFSPISPTIYPNPTATLPKNANENHTKNMDALVTPSTHSAYPSPNSHSPAPNATPTTPNATKLSSIPHSNSPYHSLYRSPYHSLYCPLILSTHNTHTLYLSTMKSSTYPLLCIHHSTRKN